MIGIGIADSLGVNLSGLNPATKSFITSAGISDAGTVTTINNLVNGLQASGLWSKMKAVYPFVTDNRNLASYTEDFGNAYWTKANTTATLNATTAPNGSSTADLIIPSVLSAPHVIYTQPFIGGSQIVTNTIYAKAAGYNFIGLSDAATGQAVINLSNGTIVSQDSGITASTPVNVGNGWWRCTITFTATTNRGLGVDVWSDGSRTTFAGNGTSGVYLWGAQSELGTTATTYQPIATTQQAYIASQFKYNLKDPRDADAAFRLVFNGGWTFDKTGATPNGVNGYADTKLVPSSVLALNSSHISGYTRTNTSVLAPLLSSENASTYANGIFIWPKYSGNLFSVRVNDDSSDSATAVTNTQGLHLATRTASNVKKYRHNTTQIFSNTTASSVLNVASIYIGASRNNPNYSTHQTAFNTIGDGLTDDDAANLYYYTQVFQTSLGRQVGSPAYALPNTYDANAKLYLSAIGSTTNNTFNNAINTFITGLKADGIYSKMKAVYPFATDNVNLASYTEDFSNAYWQKVGVVVTANDTIAPDGTMTADKVVFSGINKELYTTVGGAGTYTISVYIKGTAGETISFGDGAGVSSLVFTLTGNWQRINVTTTASNFQFDLNTYTGTARTIWLWGAQAELGSTATAYQPILTTRQAFIANQFKFNMINPQDDDTAFRLVFNGGWTHSPQGATPNGVNAYADTKLVPSSVLSQNSTHISSYIRNTSQGVLLGTDNLFRLWITPNFNGTQKYVEINSGATSSPTTPISTALGLWMGSRIINTQSKLYNNSSLNYTVVRDSVGLDNLSIFISARNTITPSNYSTSQTAFSSIGDGLSDTEAANLYTRVQTLNQTLLRQVGVPIVSDADAQAFLNAAEITDVTQADAINTLVTGLKADGLWTKMKAIYPFVGGTATTHKYNLKDPRDLDAAYRLVFNGGWTHDTNGATPNGTNGYANTYLIPSSALTTSSAHFAKYNRTNDLAGDKLDGTFFNATTSWFQHNYTSANAIMGNGGVASYTATDTRGLFTATRTAANSLKVFRNLSNVATNTDLVSASAGTALFLGARNDGGNGYFWNTYQTAFSSIGDGLTDLDASNLYTRVQNYNTQLSRQV